MFQDWRHILLLKTGYTGANRRDRMSTVFNISVLRVNKQVGDIKPHVKVYNSERKIIKCTIKTKSTDTNAGFILQDAIKKVLLRIFSHVMFFKDQTVIYRAQTVSTMKGKPGRGASIGDLEDQ